MKVRFYHFTSKEHLEAIRRAGYIYPNGDVPITPGSAGFRALWLTSDSDPRNQDWIRGSVMNKSEVRLSIDLYGDKPGLAYFPEMATIFNMDEKWLDALDPRGFRKNWWIYTEAVEFKESMIEAGLAGS